VVTLRLLVAPKGGRETPSSRYRIHDLLPLLEQRGWETVLLTPSTIRERRLFALVRDLGRASRRCEVLLIQRPGRRREESLVLRAAARRARLVAIDVDDPMDEVGIARWAVEAAELALVGSHVLESRYAGRIRRVVLIPTGLDVNAYAHPRIPQDPPVIGWIGDGPSYASSLVRMVAAAGSASDRWRLRVVGTKGGDDLERRLREAAGSMPIELVSGIDWQNEAKIAREVARYDVGLAPFRDPAGASFKTVQYLAAGAVPLVEAGGEGEHHARAALGPQAVVVRPGSEPDIVAALSRLADPAVRSELSRIGREQAKRLYSREAIAATVDNALRRALGAQP
jgi:glycosyltransferase involved in cell wall biosynthesis